MQGLWKSLQQTDFGCSFASAITSPKLADIYLCELEGERMEKERPLCLQYSPTLISMGFHYSVPEKLIGVPDQKAGA